MKKFIRITLIVLAIVAIIILIMPQYLRTALIYQTPDLDDYLIFNNRTIKASKPAPWHQHTNYGTLEIPIAWQDSFFKFDPVAFLIIKDGQLLFEEYFNDHRPEEPSGSFSMAKTIIALLVGAAIDDGYIKDLHQPVKDFLPDFAISDHDVTLYHLLTMTSGLDWDEEYSAAFSITTKAYYGRDLEKLMKPIGIMDTPGSVFYYTSGTTQLLAFLLEAATGKTVSDYATEKLWSKIGAEHRAFWSLDREDGIEKAYCCFNSNARDYARLGQLMLNKGSWAGQQIIPEWLIEQATTPLNYVFDKDGNRVDYYGFQTWILKHRGLEIPYFRGILGQYIFVIPQMDAVVVRLGHKRSSYRINNIPSDVYIYIDMFLDMMGEGV